MCIRDRQSRGTRPKLNWTMRFVDIAQSHAAKQPGLAKRRALQDLCSVMFNISEFVYID